MNPAPIRMQQSWLKKRTPSEPPNASATHEGFQSTQNWAIRRLKRTISTPVATATIGATVDVPLTKPPKGYCTAAPTVAGSRKPMPAMVWKVGRSGTW